MADTQSQDKSNDDEEIPPRELEWVYYEEREDEPDRYHEHKHCGGDHGKISVRHKCEEHGVEPCSECVGDTE